MSVGTFIKDDIKFYFTETDDIKICVCPEKGGELSSVKYKKLLPGQELLFRGNDYSDTNMAFKGRAPLMWPAVTRNYIKEVEKSIKDQKIPEMCNYCHKDKIYHIGRSAFAKDIAWKFKDFDHDGSINLHLESSPITKEIYPFDFHNEASFGIENNIIFMIYTIKNH